MERYGEKMGAGGGEGVLFLAGGPAKFGQWREVDLFWFGVFFRHVRKRNFWDVDPSSVASFRFVVLCLPSDLWNCFMPFLIYTFRN